MSTQQSPGDPIEQVLEAAKELAPDLSEARVLRHGRYYPSGDKAKKAAHRLYRARLQFVEMLMARDMWSPALGKRIAPLWCPLANKNSGRVYMRKVAGEASRRIHEALSPDEVKRNMMVRAETGSRQLAHGGQWRAWARVADVQMRLYGIGRQGENNVPNVTQNVQIVTTGDTKMLRMGSMQSLFRGRDAKALPPSPVEPSDV